ncbi:YlcI/YnfO family protein [Adlercreutzia mucosicola]|uniref:YlcI/YnfO family protein n=1 Tax=Adlercreutzia mucosicola TaxID=580026 RepID=UPI0004820E3E|nr:YlcI/YnfO family protein [Adlercreutzia mucosicola]MCR2035146.1 hypothetical protein [Adlercreutzia mucosicola]
MKFTELVDSGANKTKQHEYLVDGEQTAITIRIPSNLREAVVEAANLKGLSFSAFARMCMIDELVKEEK